MRLFVVVAFGVSILLCATFAGAANDAGYEVLFETYTEPENFCSKLGKSGSLNLEGTFVLPSVAQFEMGGNAFTSVLDGFGKLHAFSFKPETLEVCFVSRMISSGFYNQSVDTGKIAPGVLFMDTEPKLNYSSMDKLTGPNDNVYVNTINVGETWLSLTDSQYMLSFGLDDLSVRSLVKWGDRLDSGKVSTGSAHALKRGDCMIDIDPQSNMDGTDAKVLVYELCCLACQELKRTELNSYNTSIGYVPYMHSFGLTSQFAVLPHQSFYFDYNQVLKQGKPLVDAMVETAPGGFEVKIVPLNGEKVITMKIDQPEPFYYFHIVNSFEVTSSEDGSLGVVMDLSCLSINMLPYFTLEMERTKSIRDQATFGSIVVKRYTMWVKGPSAGTWTVDSLTDPQRSTDFPNINKAYQGRPNCIFYALQWFHDYQTYADMAVMRRDTCKDKEAGNELYWHKDNYFPSEPTFVSSGSGEDQGVLLFTAVHGATKQSYLMVVDAVTMTTIEEIPIPGVITFTTHGEWFPRPAER